MKSLAIIPARGGSKRIPGKNLREFGGRPIIAWPIAAAADSGLFERVLVSTDDEAIADVARQLGAEVTEERPASLSGDHTPLMEVMKYEAAQVARRAEAVEAICFLMATAAFVTTEALAEGHRRIGEGAWDYAIAASEFPAPVQRAFFETEGGGTRMVFDGMYGSRSNDLEPAYFDAGQFYWGRVEKWIEPTKDFFGERTTMVKIPRHLAQDIDTLEDWMFAEKLFAIAGLGRG